MNVAVGVSVDVGVNVGVNVGVAVEGAPDVCVAKMLAAISVALASFWC